MLLFDGTTLNGWNSWKTKEALKPGAWVAGDGMLIRMEDDWALDERK